MLSSLASHVAVALECALARDRTEQYQRELADERDRLRLVLEINNYVVSKLDINDLLRAASESIRSYFGSDFTGFWVLKEQSGQLQRVFFDFPDGKGLMAEVGSADLSAANFERVRARQGQILTAEDLTNSLPVLRTPSRRNR